MLSRAAVAVCLALGLGPVAFGDIVTIDYPGPTSTVATAINDSGQIVGEYALPCPPFPQTCSNGAFLDSGGVFSLLPAGFVPNGINNSGQIVGLMNSQMGVLDSHGVFSALSIPGAVAEEAFGINNRGDIADVYATSGFGPDYGFVYTVGTVTTINGPTGDTWAFGIDDSDQVLVYLGGQGYALYSGGLFYPINVPGSTATIAQGINDQGEIMGWCFDPNGIHGSSDINGVYSSFDAPGATQTYAYGVNNGGQIVGYYVDASGVNHGFLDTPVPEPSSIVPLASATGVLAFARLRRKRRTA